MLPSYTPGDAAAYLSARGWQFKTSGDELILRECLFCGKRDKLYINNQSGAYQCWSAACSKQGNYFTLRKDLGDPVQPIKSLRAAEPQPKKRVALSKFASFEQNLLGNAKAMEYLAGRGISVESVKAWHLGLKVEQGQNGQPVEWLMIPYITRQGDIADVKYRALPPAPKQFKRRGGGESILFGEHLLPDKKQKVDTLYLCEGELDAISLTQHGFSPALSTTTGAKSFSPRWYDIIVNSGAKRIILIYDNDVDGRAGAEKLVKKFNDEEREVLDVVLEDAKDANEFFLAHTAEDLNQLIQDCRPAEIDYVVSMATAIDMLQEELFLSGNGLNGIPSQFPNINSLIDGGYWNGFLVTIVGSSGTGKTSFALQEQLYQATNGHPTYMCCLEMPVGMMLRKVINHFYHIPILDIKDTHVRQYADDLMRRQFYMGGHGIRDLDALERTIRQAVRRYDLKSVCFDNINFLVRSTDRVHAELARVTKRLKELAVDLNIVMYQIAQPRKFDSGERIINENDVKDSAAIEQDSDVMILLWRPPVRTDIKDFGKSVGQKENKSPLTLVRVAKARYSPGGETMLYFHGDISTFRMLADDERLRLMQEAESQPSETKTRRGRN